MKELLKHITMDPEICHGKPTVRGLRYPVSMILELLSAGMTADQILDDYADLEPKEIAASLAFAAQLADIQRVIPLAA
jgi:uncharacterized protein (DUF433 family)